MDDCWTIVLGFTKDYQTYKSLYLPCKNFYEFFQDGWETYRNGLQKIIEEIEQKKQIPELAGCDEIFNIAYRMSKIYIDKYGIVNNISVEILVASIFDKSIDMNIFGVFDVDQFNKFMSYYYKYSNREIGGCRLYGFFNSSDLPTI